MERSEYIGSSDARDILTGNWDWLYRLKKGLVEPPDLTRNFKVQLGKLTEEFHIDWTLAALAEELQRGTKFIWSKGTTDKQQVMKQHFASLKPNSASTGVKLGSTPDALFKIDDAQFAVEAKHTGRSFSDALDFYMPQMQHHMLCWGHDKILFSAIVGNSEPERAWVGYSESWAEQYITRCDDFWRHVAENHPPSPSFIGSKTEVIMPTNVKDTIPIDGMKKRDVSRDNRFKAIAAEFIETKPLVAKHNKAKDDLKAMMADDERELYSDELTLTRNKAGSILFKIHEKD